MDKFCLVHTDWHQHPLSAADQLALAELGVEVVLLNSRSREEFLGLAASADVILNSDFRITADLMSALKKCRLISRYGSGLDNIDVEAATRLGIAVANVREFCTDAVADRTFSLLLACSCSLALLNRYPREGEWGLKDLPFAIELKGKTLGLVGFGKIGRAVADRARGFGLAVIAYDPYVGDECMQAHGARRADLEGLLAHSDFVSLHAPLTEETLHLLDEGRIGLMKPSCILINTARGRLVDEGALLCALRAKRLYGAGLDVFEKEPPDPGNPLFALDNVTVTPHCGAHTKEATERVRRQAVDTVIAFFRNEQPENVVNPEAWQRVG